MGPCDVVGYAQCCGTGMPEDSHSAMLKIIKESGAGEGHLGGRGPAGSLPGSAGP
jgi:hypothetical protein